MRVDAEREPRVRMSEVLRHRLEGLTGVDEHRRVEVPERMHAVRAGRLEARTHERRLPDVRVEVVAVERLALAAREHERVPASRMQPQVLGELDRYSVGEGHDPCLAALRKIRAELAPHDLHLLLDPQPMAKEVHVADPQPEGLALAEPVAGGDDGDRSIAAWQRLDDGRHVVDGPRLDLGRLDARRLHGSGGAGVTGDQAVVDRGREDQRDVGVDHPHGPGHQFPLKLFLARWPSEKAMRRVRQRIRELTDRRRLLLPVEVIVADVNRVLRGWAEYFRYGNSARHFDKVRNHAAGMARAGGGQTPSSVTGVRLVGCRLPVGRTSSA